MEREEQDKLSLPWQMAATLAVLKAAQRTREGRSWHVTLNTRKNLSPPDLLRVSSSFLLKREVLPARPSPQSKNHPPPPTPQTKPLPVPARPLPISEVLLPVLDEGTSSSCCTASTSQATSVQAWSLLVWSKSLPVPSGPFSIRPSPHVS